jgi:hypothetical protein
MEKTYVSRIGTHFMMTGIPGLMKLLTERRSDGMDSASRLERVRRLGANTTSALLALQHCSQPAISSHDYRVSPRSCLFRLPDLASCRKGPVQAGAAFVSFGKLDPCTSHSSNTFDQPFNTTSHRTHQPQPNMRLSHSVVFCLCFTCQPCHRPLLPSFPVETCRG